MLTALPAVLKDYGISCESLLGEQGIPVDVLAHPDNALPFDAFCRLVARCTAVTRRNDLGLLLCEKTGASSLGLVGFLLMQAPDVGTGLRELVAYLHHHDRGAAPFLRRKDGLASLGYVILHSNLPGTDQVYDGAAAIAFNILRGLCGPQWGATSVHLSRRRPSSPARYEKFFGAPVTFGAEETGIFFSEKWLETKVASPDGALRQMLREQIELLELEEAGNIAEQVRRLMRTALTAPSCSLDDISRLLGMSRRTLARRLQEEGATFRSISENARFEIARQLLRNTSMSVIEISAALHFSEQSAFARAFKQWSGVTPQNWRLSHDHGSASPNAERI